MDELIVIKVMNEAMLRLKKGKNEDYSIHEKIDECLKDKDFFLKAKKDTAMKVLLSVGVSKDKLEETYGKLIKKI